MLSKDEILTIGKTKNFITVNIDGMGEVGIREITAGERDLLEAAGARGLQNPNARQDFRARFVAAGLCDANGDRIFRDGDLAQISALNSRAIDQIFVAMMDYNKMRDDDLDDAEKN